MTAGRKASPEPPVVVDSTSWTGDPPPPEPPKSQKPQTKLGLALGSAFMLGLAVFAVRVLWLGYEAGTVPLRHGGGVSYGERPAAFVLVMAFWSLVPLFWVAILWRVMTSAEVRRSFVAMWREAP